MGLAAAATARRPVEPLMPAHLSDRRRAGLTQAIHAGLQLPADQHPALPKRKSRRPTEAERRRFVDLAQRRDARAESLEIDPTLIASRATVSLLAQNWDRYAPELMSWQKQLLEP